MSDGDSTIHFAWLLPSPKLSPFLALPLWLAVVLFWLIAVVAVFAFIVIRAIVIGSIAFVQAERRRRQAA